MREFKAVSFVVFDGTGKSNRVTLDVTDNDQPYFTLKGDASILLQRLDEVVKMVETYLKDKQSEAERSD